MKLETYTRQEVIDMPMDQLRQMNKLWREAIKKHWELWVYEQLKRNPRPFDEFLLDQQELKELHFQFRWELMSGEDRMKEKFKNRKNKIVKNESYFDGTYSYEEALFQPIYEEEE